jgi:DNA (cytosine-5)-methyltransferase 1
MPKSAMAHIGDAELRAQKPALSKELERRGLVASRLPEVQRPEHKGANITGGEGREYSNSAAPLRAVNPSHPADQSADVGHVLPKIVSLFSGAGGLDLGFKDAGFQVAVAFDASKTAIRTHKRNFPGTESAIVDLAKVTPSGVAALIAEKIPPGERIGVIGGPPCQGFSRANTTAQPDDPRNKLPDIYLKIITELQRTYTVEFFVFENVLGIGDKKHTPTYQALVAGLSALGFATKEMELCALDFGVPQNRRRIVLSGMRSGQNYTEVYPRKQKGKKTVQEAIGGLQAPVFFRHGLSPEEFPVHPNHWTMKPKSPRFSNPRDSSVDGRSFKRLNWQKASPTIAFGHREIHVHPNGDRRISLYEALRLQGFPHGFVLEGNLSEQVEQVSNAVPPPLARSLARAVKRALLGK